MTPSRDKAVLAALLAGAGIAAGVALWPAVAQNSPESILPPGFSDPIASTPETPTPGVERGPTDLLPSLTLDGGDNASGEEGNTAEEEELTDEEALELELPAQARRPIDVVGPLEPGFGLAPDAFGSARGRFLTVLMDRIDAPVASRWASILLRRALLSRVPTPSGIEPADWIAARAWLLLRMGEADGARMLVQSVDVDKFNARMFAVAAQVALATADPAALCPLAPTALAFSREPIWPMASAMCTALSGEPSVSSALIDQVRIQRKAGGIDLMLAEKVAGAAADGRRAITIEWDGVDRLTAWRFGMANAVAVPIPPQLFATVGPHVQAWQARAPMVSAEGRLAPARTAAALGVFSNAALVSLYAQAADDIDIADFSESDPGRLREAYAGEDDSARLVALRALWSEAKSERDRYAMSVLTARAAARIAPSADHADDAANLIAAMFSAGLDRQAARWSGVVTGMDDADADAAWALLAVGSPRPSVAVSYDRVDAYRDRAGDAGLRKVRMLVAALGGLGRLSQADEARLAEQVGIPLARQDNWTRALVRAMQGRQQGTVALLVATAMQTKRWETVPARHFRAMLAGLRQVGLENEARMIAAEAMSRL